MPALRVGRRLGLPVVYEVRAFWEDAAVDHGTTHEGSVRYRLTRALETYALKRADAVITICEGLRRDMLARGIPASKITVVPNAVDAESFDPAMPSASNVRQRAALEDAVVLGFVGSFYAYEGLALLLQALPALLRQNPMVRLLLVGGGPQDSELQRLAAELGVAQFVTFAGRVPHDEVQHYYDAIDILVYPRLSMRLTDLVTPLKPLEAMAQRRLVLASDVGGHRELMRDGETAVLFKSGDVTDLVNRALALIDDRGRWPKIREAARRFVEPERTWKASVDNYVPVYGRLLERLAA
jgi:PEP-CTERM/exosortase A-associated glycosyltransferase